MGASFKDLVVWQRGEYLQFLGHAHGSNRELRNQLIISRNLGFASGKASEKAERLSADASRMLIALMKKLHK
jgi:four helix bundle protein